MTPTTLSFPSGKLNYTSRPLNVTYPQSGGKGAAKGSFATSSAKMQLNLRMTYTQWAATCQRSSRLASHGGFFEVQRDHLTRPAKR
jgi:hypothetical protein